MTDTFFTDAYSAYRVGRRRPIVSVESLDDLPAPDALMRVGERVLSADEIEFVVRVGKHRERGFHLAKQGDAEAGAEFIRRAVEIAESDTLRPVLRMFVETFLYSNASYVSFRLGNLSQALAEAQRSLDATSGLVRLEEFEMLAGRRIHLLTNVIRVLLESGDPTGCVARTAEMLRYLEGSPVTRPFDADQRARPLRREDPTYALERYESRPAVHYLPLVFARYADEADDLVGALAAYADDETPQPLPQIRAWFEVQAALAAGDVAAALARAAVVLDEGRGAYPLLWHGCVADVCRCAEQVGSPTALRVQADMLGDTHVLSPYPPRFRQKVDRLYGSEGAPIRRAAA